MDSCVCCRIFIVKISCARLYTEYRNILVFFYGNVWSFSFIICLDISNACFTTLYNSIYYSIKVFYIERLIKKHCLFDFRNDPAFLFWVLCALFCTFKSYPAYGDAAFYFNYLPIWSFLFLCKYLIFYQNFDLVFEFHL